MERKETTVAITSTPQAIRFFKGLLELPDKSEHWTMYETTKILFKNIDKEELYRDLQNWLNSRRDKV